MSFMKMMEDYQKMQDEEYKTLHDRIQELEKLNKDYEKTISLLSCQNNTIRDENILLLEREEKAKEEFNDIKTAMCEIQSSADMISCCLYSYENFKQNVTKDETVETDTKPKRRGRPRKTLKDYLMEEEF